MAKKIRMVVPLGGNVANQPEEYDDGTPENDVQEAPVQETGADSGEGVGDDEGDDGEDSGLDPLT